MDILDTLDHIVCAICGCREMRALHQFAGVVLVTRYLVIALVESVCFQSLKMNIDLFIGKKFSSEKMEDNSTSSLPFCLTPLWDMDLTWNTDNPDFTRYSIQYLSFVCLQISWMKSRLN